MKTQACVTSTLLIDNLTLYHERLDTYEKPWGYGQKTKSEKP